MRKHNTEKRSLIINVLTLILCVSVLCGTTYAWFAETISFKGTTIQTSTLDVEVTVYDRTEEAYVPVEGKNLFAEYAATPLEPGSIQIVYLQVANTGDTVANVNAKVGIFDPAATTVVVTSEEEAQSEAETDEALTAQAVISNPADSLEYAVLAGISADTPLQGTWEEIKANAVLIGGSKASGKITAAETIEVLDTDVVLPVAVQQSQASESGEEALSAEESTAHVQYLAFAVCLPSGAGLDSQGAAIEHLGLQIIAEQLGVVEAEPENIAAESQAVQTETSEESGTTTE